MAEYFARRNQAEPFLQGRYPKDRTAPVFIGEVSNRGTEKRIIAYDPRQNPAASPFLVRAIKQRLLSLPPAPPLPLDDSTVTPSLTRFR